MWQQEATDAASNRSFWRLNASHNTTGFTTTTYYCFTNITPNSDGIFTHVIIIIIIIITVILGSMPASLIIHDSVCTQYHSSCWLTLHQITISSVWPLANTKNQLFDLSSSEPHAQPTFVRTCICLKQQILKWWTMSCILLNGTLQGEKYTFNNCKIIVKCSKNLTHSQTSVQILSIKTIQPFDRFLIK